MLPALCQHYDLTPPVDPADHDTEGVASAVRRRVTTQRLRVALRALSVPIPAFVVTHWALPFYRYPSRELDCRCALSSLSPTTHAMGMGGNRLLRGIVLERLPNLGLNCGSISVAQFPRTCYREAKVVVHLCFRRTRQWRVFSFLGSNLHPIIIEDPAVDLKKDIKRIS